MSWGQSASDLAQKFRHHEVYEVEPGVVMWADYAQDGLVCEMHVEQTHSQKIQPKIGYRNMVDLARASGPCLTLWSTGGCTGILAF